MLSLLPPSSSPERPLSAACDSLGNITELFAFNPNLSVTFDKLQDLTSVLNNGTVHILTINGMISPIQYHLLKTQSAGCKSPQYAAFHELCCLGFLVYLKTIYEFHISVRAGRFPAGIFTNAVLTEKLKACLDKADMSTPQLRALFLWILCIGGVSVAGTTYRTWFVAQLAKTIMELQLHSWGDTKQSLKGVLWVDRIHGDPCRTLWDEAQTTVTVLFGGNSKFPWQD